jgi:hypothetical protein
MKQKDFGNKQRYDPVSKRMITLNPETPGVSGVTLISISQPVFEDTSFVSEYTVTFRRYDGCLSVGNEVTCFIYNSVGTQVAKTVATLKQGVNTLVVKGEHTPRLNEYYASVVYGLTAFNSKPRRLISEFPVISSVSATTSSLNFYQNNEVSVNWSYDNSFFWTGTLNISFVSYDTDGSPATLSVRNITDSPDDYPLIISNPNFNVSYGRNTITLPNITIINIPTGSGRSGVPYKDTEILTVSITHLGETYSGNIIVRPALIQDVVLEFIDAWWTGSNVYVSYRGSYRLADGTQSSLRSNEFIDYPYLDGQSITVYESRSNGYILDIAETSVGGQLGRVDKIGSYEFSGISQRPVYLDSLSYYAEVGYSDQSFSETGIANVRSPEISILRPELTSSPVISFSNFRIASGGFFVDFTVTFDYQPRNTPQISSELTLKSTSPVLIQTANIFVGSNILQLEDVSVTPGTSYSVSFPIGSVVSTSVPVIIPTYDLFQFTSIPTFVETVDLATFNPIAFSISISWNNIIPNSGSGVIIQTVGLAQIAYGAIDSSVTYTPSSSGISTYTFNVNPVNPPTGNAIEQNLARWVFAVGSFPYFKFKITDVTTGGSVLSSVIGSSLSDNM